MARLALVIGEGALPGEVYRAAKQAHTVHVFALKGHRYPAWVLELSAFERTDIALCRIGKLFTLMRRSGCVSLCTVGKVHRPSKWDILLSWDVLAWRLLARGIVGRGDDTVIRMLAREAARYGLTLVDPRQFLGQASVVPQSPTPEPYLLTKTAPRPSDWETITTGTAVLQAMSPFDIGQSIVVAAKQVLAVEAAEGTQAMLSRCRQWEKSHRAVLIKHPKWGQLSESDMPAIGPETIQDAATANCVGIALQDLGHIVIDRAATIALADSLDLFIVVCPRAEPRSNGD